MLDAGAELLDIWSETRVGINRTSNNIPSRITAVPVALASIP
jgi:hypothetical protein